MDGSNPGPRRGHITERAVTAAAVALVIGALFVTRTPAATASSPVVEVHSGPGGVVVDSPTVTATGTGRVEGVPDTLTVPMNVTTSAEHASDALEQCNQKTSVLIQTLLSAGAAQKDIATDSLSIQPQYRGGENAVITGYSVSENVTVTLHDLGKAGAVIDAAAHAVGDSVRVNGMSLSISDTSALMAKARAEAVTDARSKADAMASGAGVKLGTVKTITEGSSYTPQTWNYATSASLQGVAPDVPVSPGQQQLSVNVTVVYTLGT